MRALEGKVAVVTGAASGIGRALALELASRGCDVALTDLQEQVIAEVAQQVRALGRQASHHAFDVGDADAWPGFVAALEAQHGAVQLLVNNAGVSLTGPFAQCSLEDLRWQIDVNLWGVVHGCHFLLPLLTREPEARIVNLSSIFGIICVPDNAAYCMSKHAVRALTESLEIELRGTGVRMTSVHPGAVATRIVTSGRFLGGGFTSSGRARRMIEAGMPPEQAARIIADGIQAGRRRILVGTDARVLARIQQAMPVRYRDIVSWWTRRR